MSDISHSELPVSSPSVHALAPLASSSPLSSPISPSFSPLTTTPHSSFQSPPSLCLPESSHCSTQPSPSQSSFSLHRLECIPEDEHSVLPTSPLPLWHGFKIVGDNLDKQISPRHQTMERRVKSLHFFNCYAVLDRLNLSSYTDETPTGPLSLDIDDILPSESDHTTIISNFAVLAGRVVQQYMPAFKNLPCLVTEHIDHIHQKEMCQQSRVVSLELIIVSLLIHCLHETSMNSVTSQGTYIDCVHE